MKVHLIGHGRNACVSIQDLRVYLLDEALDALKTGQPDVAEYLKGLCERLERLQY